MRAFEINSYAHPSKLSLIENVPLPNPGPNDVVVEVYSAALNFFDVCYLEFLYVNCNHFDRSYKLKANTRISLPSRLFWERNWQAR